MIKYIFLTIFASIVSSLISEALSYWMLYRKEDYIYLRDRVEYMEKEIKKASSSSSSAGGKKKKGEKKLAMFKRQLTSRKQELNKFKMKPTMVTSLLFMGTVYYLKQGFEGIVVARLPFEPLSIVQSLSHRGLIGDDFTECSFLFLYILCSMGIRANVKRILGFAPKTSSTGVLFDIPDDAEIDRRSKELFGG